MYACDGVTLRSCCTTPRAPRVAASAFSHRPRPPPPPGLMRCTAARGNLRAWRTSVAAVRACAEGGRGDASTAEPTIAPAAAPSFLPAIDWLRTWYAVGMVDAFATDAPTPLRLVDVPLVLWRDGSGEWRALRDECPHRLAPLSQGRIAEDGTLQARARAAWATRQLDERNLRHRAARARPLAHVCAACVLLTSLVPLLALAVIQCSYHGWRFEGSGACACVPQLHGATAERSPRTSAAAFPTAVAQGLLYVWADAGPGSFEAARATPLPLVAGLQGAPGGPRVVERGVPYVRDLLYGIDTLIENLADPGHVAYAHHGIVVRDAAAAGRW